MFWSVGPFWYMVYGIWYVVYGKKMAFTVYSHMFCVCHAQAAYNIEHLFLVSYVKPYNSKVAKCVPVYLWCGYTYVQTIQCVYQPPFFQAAVC